MEATIRNRYSIIITIFFHFGIFALLLLLGFKTPLPLPSEQGITVNFGNSDDGFGITEPEQLQQQSSAMQNNQEGVLTQNIEDAVSIKNNNITNNNNQTQNQNHQQQQQVNQNALFPTNQNNGSNSEGETHGNGNQGVANGDPNVKNHNGTPNGTGNSYSLAGRNINGSLPKPNYPGNEQGKVVVEIFVDRSGVITKANAGIKGSTLLSKKYLDAAYNAALKAKFDANPDAAELQRGTITYNFILQ